MHTKYIFGLLLICLSAMGCDNPGRLRGSSSKKFGSGHYHVQSNCPGYLSDGIVYFDNDDTFFGPLSKDERYNIADATSFGFPSSIFKISGPHKIVSENDGDTCVAVVYTDSDLRNLTTSALFRCRLTIDDQSQLCLIDISRK